MENRTKVQTFIGFAMRTGQYKIGVNACQTLKKAKLMLVCHTASENTVKDAMKLAKKFHCKLCVTTNKTLEEYTNKPNSKVMAIANVDLAKSILENKQSELIERN